MTSVPQSVLDHIAAGRKIEAIKEVRALTGYGLREAKETVEAIQRGDLGSLQVHHQPDLSSERSDPNELATRVFSLVQDGRKIQAIKEVKDATGVGLAEAKQIVEQVEAGQSLNDPSSPQQATSRRAARLVVIAALLVALMGFAVTWLMAA